MSSAATMPCVLLFGGNGSVARLMTEQMLSRSWRVVSVIRRADQAEEILRRHGKENPSNLKFITADLANIKTKQDADKIVLESKPNFVIFAASDMRNVWQIDCNSAKQIIKSSVESLLVSKFLTISFPSARRNRAPWWDDHDERTWRQEIQSYPDIAQAKLDVDEYLIAMAEKIKQSNGPLFQAISLRPSWFSGNKTTGKIQLGKTRHMGQVSRGDVAATAIALLSRDNVSGWFDLLQGDQNIEDAIDIAIKEKINSVEGEDLNSIYKINLEN